MQEISRRCGHNFMSCPTCSRIASRDYYPFCSKRCADVDLHRWLAGVYAIAAGEDEEGDADAVAPDAFGGDAEDE